MTWVIFRYENGRKIEILIKADSFDEALKGKKKQIKDFVGVM